MNSHHLLIPFFLLTFSGNFISAHADEWDDAVAYFEKNVGTLDIENLVPEKVPDAENYGAIGPLRGITIPEDVEHELRIDGELARAKLMEALEAILTDEGGDRHGTPASGAFSAGTRVELKSWLPPHLEEKLGGKKATPEEIGKILLKEVDMGFGDFLAQSDAAVGRKHSQLVPRVSQFYNKEIPFATPVSHATATISLTQMLYLRAIAAINIGDAKVAETSIHTIFRLIELESPYLVGMIQFLVANTEFRIAIGALWEGLASRGFDEESLTRLQSRFAAMDAFEEFAKSLHAESIALSHLNRESLIEFGKLSDPDFDYSDFPQEWIDDSKAFMLRHYCDSLIKPLKEHNLAALKKTVIKYEEESKALYAKGDRWRMLKPTEGLESPHLQLAFATSMTQAYGRMTTAACALERYFIKNGEYPETLDALVPDFLTSVPTDPVDSNPIRYRRTDDGRYLLYSIGWDLKDGGGIANAPELSTEGDWIWTYGDAR